MTAIVKLRLLSLLGCLLASSALLAATNAPPANDNFENASTLQPDAIVQTSFLNSSLQPGEQKPIRNAISSLWWTFTPTETKSYSISAFADLWLPYSTVMAYRGDSLATLIPLLNHSPVTANNRSYFSFRATAGQTIRIQVLHSSPDAKAVSVYLRSGPSNDDFQNAVSITNNIVKGNTLGATSEAEESFTQTVWFQWKPDQTSGYEFRFPIQSLEAHSLFIFEGDAISNLELVGHTKATLMDSFTAHIFADASKSYYIAVSALSVYAGAFQFHINQAPANDAFLHRFLIQKLDEDISADFTLATREPGEPFHQGKDSTHTLWYEWIAPTNGGHYLETTNSSSLVAIYSGDNLTNLTTIPTKIVPSGAGGRTTKAFTFRATEGQSYLFAIHDDQPGTFTFRIRSGPPNDEFANAAPITLDTDIEQSFLAATREPGEPPVLTGETVWHRFTAPADGTYFALTTLGRGEASVFRGSSLTNLILTEHLSSSDIAFPFHATNGETLFIAVAAEQLITCTLSIRTAPVNDNFADRIPLFSSSVITNAAGATIEPGEPIHSTNFATGSLWWTWTPTNTGIYRIQNIVPSVGSVLAIYTGTALTNLTLISRPEGFVDLYAQAGVEYVIAATYLPVGNDPAVLEIHTPPAHDNFSAALHLTLNEPLTNSFVVATREPGENTRTDLGTVWYSWTSPSNGPFLFATQTIPDYPSVSFIYSGSAVTNLVQVPSFSYHSNGTHVAAFYAMQGMTYRLSIEALARPVVCMVTVAVWPGHPHDDFANALFLSGTFVGWSNTLFGATTEPGEELLSTRPSLWARWIAPDSGTYKIVSASNLGVGVYTGTSITNLSTVAATVGTNTTLIFKAEAGATYHLRATPGSLLSFVLRLGPAAPNESPATATELTGDNISLVGQNWTATAGSGLYFRTIWYKWTTPGHGLITYSSATNTAITAYHTRFPTLDSNLVVRSSLFPDYTSTTNVAVTAGVTYYFGLRLPTLSTNIPFNLQFEPKSVSLGPLSGALLGGNAFWSQQTNFFYSAPDALRAGPLERFHSASIEFVTYGPGTLKLRTKLDNSYGTLTVTSRSFTRRDYGSHEWTLRTFDLRSSYNVVRITLSSRGYLTEKPTAWLDDIEFTSQPPFSPSLAIITTAGSGPRIIVPVEGGRITTVETSTDLTDWFPWTNILSATTAYPHLSVTQPTNDAPQFFRARVMP